MRKKEIPIILFNMETVQWEPYDTGHELSVILSIYRNQIDETERRSLFETDATGELHAFRNERRRAAMAEKDKKKKSGIRPEMLFCMLMAAVFYVLWLYFSR